MIGSRARAHLQLNPGAPLARGLSFAMPVTANPLNFQNVAADRRWRVSKSGSGQSAELGRRGPVIRFASESACYLYTTKYGTNNSDFLPTAANCSIVLAWRKTDSTNRTGRALLTGSGTSLLGLYLPYSDGTVYFDYGGTGAGSTRVSKSGLTLGDDIWVFTVGPRGMEIWQNGVLRASNTAKPTRTSSSARLNINGDGSGDRADFGGLLVYKRQLAMHEIVAITADMHAPFRPPKRRVVAPVAASGTSPQTVALGRASSTESARALTVSTALATALARASETDAARALTASSALAQAVGRASETDEARALTVAATLAVAIARATETDVSRELTAALALAIGVGRASESNEARGLVLPQTLAMGRASESSEARALAVDQPSPEPEPGPTAGSGLASSGGIVSGHGLQRISTRRNRILRWAFREAIKDVRKKISEEIDGSEVRDDEVESVEQGIGRRTFDFLVNGIFIPEAFVEPIVKLHEYVEEFEVDEEDEESTEILLLAMF